MSRELIPRRRSGTARNPHHDLLPSQHRGRHIFGIPGLQPLALGPDLIPTSVDPISLSSRTPDDRQSRTMQVPTNPADACLTIVDYRSEEGSTPREQGHLVGCTPLPPPNAAVTPTIHAF